MDFSRKTTTEAYLASNGIACGTKGEAEMASFVLEFARRKVDSLSPDVITKTGLSDFDFAMDASKHVGFIIENIEILLPIMQDLQSFKNRGE